MLKEKVIKGGKKNRNREERTEINGAGHVSSDPQGS